MDSKPHILVVEDNAITSFHLQKLLEHYEYSVSKLKRAEDVASKTEISEPTLILMDIMLAGKMTGIEAAERVRAFSTVPIIFLTALSDQATIESIQSISNTARLPKPFDEKKLLNTIESLASK